MDTTSSLLGNLYNTTCHSDGHSGSWSNLDEFTQEKWNNFLDVVGDEPENLYVWGMFVCVYSQYWLIGGLFMIMDITGRPKALRKYKTQPGTNEPISWTDLKKILKTALMNQLLVTLPMTYFGFHLAGKYVVPAVRQLPPLTMIIRDIATCLILWESSNYCIHRLMHHRSIYKYIHMRHHEFKASTALASLYVHPLEHIFSDMVSVSLGVVLMNCHVVTTALWFSWVMHNALITHSGYHLPLLKSPEAHDYHHLKSTECYSPMGVMDWIFRTDDRFRRSKFGRRHRMIFGLRSASEIVPDKD